MLRTLELVQGGRIEQSCPVENLSKSYRYVI